MNTTTDKTLEERYRDVQRRIAEAADRVGRRPEDVYLVAVTKYAEPEQVRQLIQLGHRDFGESRVQQLVQRAAMVEESLSRLRVLPHAVQPDAGGELFHGATEPAAIRWHMIGHLQRNKVRKAVEYARLIHSVDTLRLAEELQQVASKRDTPVEVLLEVNCSGEKSKQGCLPPAAVHLAEQIDTMVQLRIRGLMTMAPYSDNPEDAAPTFARCRELFEEIAKTRIGEGGFNILSMGMSGDFEVAIREGANVVRVGTAIIGPRPEPRPEEMPGGAVDQ